MTPDVRSLVDRLYREESGRAVASLARAVGDLELAQDCVQEAVVAALDRWPRDGVPPNPAAWLMLTANRRAIDHARGAAAQRRRAGELARVDAVVAPAVDLPEHALPDDRLALMFATCHPALAPETRVALTLQAVAGLHAAEIARAFLVTEAAMAQRLVRAKQKIRATGIRFAGPAPDRLEERLHGVLATVYLVFAEGHAASHGDALVRADLCEEAIRLAGIVRDLVPDDPEPTALLGLLLLTHARKDARIDGDGALVLLGDQDRTRWHRRLLADGLRHTLDAARRAVTPGPYVLQALIAAEHARAPTAQETNWAQVVALYDRLRRVHGGPVVDLNHAIAVAEHEGPAAALPLVDALEPELRGFHRYWVARADLLRRLGRDDEARDAYARAAERAGNDVERAFLRERAGGGS